MATDAKKHTTLAAGEIPSRAAIAASIFSIDDIIPVANGTEANQVAAAIAAAGQVLASNPVFVSRADARGLHRVEYSYDGTVWIPFSGVLTFATIGARDTWTTANSSLLTALDQCRVGTDQFLWSGTEWRGEATFTPTFTGITLGNGTSGGLIRYLGDDLVFVRAWVKLGTTSAVTGPVKMTLPVNASPTASPPFDAGLTGTVNRPGIFFAPLFPVINSATEVDVLAGGANGTYLSYSAFSSTVPGTWGDGALMTIAGVYVRA